MFKIEVNPADYKILIVDDVPSNVMLLKALLKTENYQIETATDGLSALEKVAAVRPDLILLDVMMPGMDGFEVSKRLQSMPDYYEIPIIFLTALNSHEYIVKGFELGANDFITKPFDKNELKIRIKHQVSLLEAKRLLLKKTNELQSTIVERDKLYSVIAHDLRGPIGTIKMMLNLVLMNSDKVTDSELIDMLQMANQTTENTFSLLDNLLKWVKSQLGRLKMALQQIEINDLLNDAVVIFLSSAELKNIKIELDSTVKSEVSVDIDMIKTVLRNLISNAIKFSNNDSSIIISVAESDDFVTVSIKDSGCGIKEEDRPKLLTADHFSTLGTNNEEGAGLGLLLCLDFINKNGGELWFNSVEGQGSIFSFTLPKVKN